jgi:periplasmic protein TonB
MRRDLITGIILSLGIHVGLAFTGKAPPPQKKIEDPVPTIAVVEMPKIEPDEPEIKDPDEQPPTPADFAPPMLADVPSLVTDTSFVQKLSPPPPEGLRPNAAVFTIPENRTGGLGKGMEIFDISKLDQIPEVRFQAEVIYPFEMRRSGQSGEVVVEFIVDTNGAVNGAFAVKSSQREFEANAVASVMKWKFKPGKKGGRNVNTRMQVPIVFTLNDN